MARVLVSGAGGFLGHSLVEQLLKSGDWVTTVGRAKANSPLHFELGPAPWTREQWAMVIDAARPEVIYHLAGAVRATIEELHCVNVELAESLFEALQLLGVQPDLMLIGSAAEYGESIVDGVPVAEDEICRPSSNYGVSKFFQTQKALEFAQSFAGRVIIARPFNLIGAGMPEYLALGNFARQLGMGDVLMVGNLGVYRDFVDVGDAASAMRKLARSSVARGVVNICSGRAMSLHQLVEKLLLHSEREIKVVVDPNRIRHGEKRTIIGSTAKLKSFGIFLTSPDIDQTARALLRQAGRSARSTTLSPV